MHSIERFLCSRAKEKQKLKQKKLDARLNNIKLGPSRKELKHSKMSRSNCKVHVVIDLSFDDLMDDKVRFLFCPVNDCY
jgi:tRNA (guanine9-N1)-methyltransferase